jgi:ABC-2 type transport system permease protein
VLALAVGAIEVAGDVVVPLAVVLGAFLLGYAFYACAFATAGALVPRQEEVQNVTTPLTLVLVGSLFVAFAAIDDPGGGLARVASFLPPVAPIVLPVRIIAGEVAAWELALSVLLLLAATAALVRVAARIYQNAVLQTGTRVGLAQAWRAGA